MKKLILLSISTIPIILLYAQQSLPPDSIAKRLFTQTTLFPQENIYTQTDKSDYVAGDTIWFRTYLVNAISRKPEKSSRYIYAELIDAQTDTLICRIKAREDEKNMIYGYMPIPVLTYKGTYRFKTYTLYGCNWGEEGTYNKMIRIYSTRNRENTKKKKTTNDYFVDFLPEGGQAIDKQLCRFAFKAQRNTGEGENIEGTVIDEKGDTLTKFVTLHNGMGELSFVPAASKKYYALCTNKQGEQKQFTLPQAVCNAGALKVTATNKKYIVTLVHDPLFRKDSLQLVVLQRGYPCLVKYWENTENMVFEKQNFDTGIVHFLLVNSKGKIVSERLAFINHIDDTFCNITTNCTQFSPRKQINLSFEVKDSLDTFPEGCCSVSVTDSRDVPTDRTSHILSTLLLTADLKGYIEEPGWYFEKGDSNKRNKILDLIMMIHGWKRYNLQDVIDGKYTLPSQLPETSMSISGIVKTAITGKPINNAQVQVFALGNAVIKSLETGREGRFELKGFELPDSTKYLVSALSPKKKNNVVLEMEKQILPVVSSHHSWASASQNKDSSILYLEDEEKYIEKSMQNLGYSNGMKHYLLEEVKITARPKKEYKTEFEQSANITITEDRIKKSPGLLNLDMVLRVIAGPQMARGTLILDGTLIEDKIQEQQIYHTFFPGDIAQIDIIKGTRAAGFLDGKHLLIIAITTKKGGAEYNTKFVDTNMAVWTPLSYQQPVEIYTPHYEQPTVNNNKPDLRTTIYWKPDIILKNGKATISFFTADSPSTYQVVAEGISSDGKVFRKEMKLFQSEE